MAEPPKRRQLALKVSTEGYDGLQSFALAHGVTVTALVDAVGRYLAIMDSSTDRPVGPALASIVDNARMMDHERRSRAPERRADTPGQA